MLQEIGDALPRFQVYEELFQNDESLQQNLLSMYRELISFLSEAKNAFRDSASEKSSRDSRRILQKFRQKTFNPRVAKLRMYIQPIEQAAKLADMMAGCQERRESAEWRSLMTTKLFPNGM